MNMHVMVAPQYATPVHKPAGRNNTTWTAERTEMLKALISEGISFSLIAERINEEHGGVLTRNACIGKAHRLLLVVSRKPREARVRRSTARAYERRVRPAFYDAVDVASPMPELNCSIIELSSIKCHFPLGDPLEDGFAFCGNAAGEGECKPYCTFHARIAYRHPKAR
jgi:GcrA cell cycle regulator